MIELPKEGHLAMMALSVGEIKQCIHFVRGNHVILDSDLATFYGVETKSLNKTVRRNADRFPEDFMFQLLQTEYDSIKSSLGDSGWGGHRKYLPLVFTEQGAIMVSSILKTDRAVEINIAIMRAFVQKRHLYGNHENIKDQLKELKEQVFELGRKYESQSNVLVEAVQLLKNTVHSPSVNNSSPQLEYRRGMELDEQDKVHNIQRVVAEYFQIEVQDFKNASRVKRLTKARQVAMYIAREKLKLGFKEIGSYFGGRDHTTVLHACRKINKLRQEEMKLDRAIVAIENSLQ